MNTTSPAVVQAFGGLPLEFVNAKLRGRRSRLYEGRRLRDLADEGAIPELASRLYPRDDIREPVPLERRVRAACVAELASFARWLDGPYRTLYCALLNRYAVENLKVLLRLRERSGAEGEPADHLVGPSPWFSLPVEELLGSAEVGEFIAAIPLLRVRECAGEALPLYNDTGRRAYLEMAFDRGYWLGVWDAVARLSGSEAAQCAGPIRVEFDVLRLLATLRAGANYDIPWEEWRAVVPVGDGAIGLETLRRIHEEPTLEFARAALPWRDGVLTRRLAQDEAPDLGRVEEALWHETVRLANRQYYSFSEGPAVLVSFYYLKREELRHLMAIIQMLRYGRTGEEVARHLEL